MTDKEKVMLDVKDIMRLTGIGRNNTYGLMYSNQFHVVKIGKKMLVHEEVFQKWLKGETKPKKRW